MARRPPPSSPSLRDRLAAFRPRLDRAIFALALLGVLTTIHLKIQQDRGFDRGCLGFTTSEAVEATFDCALVTQSDAGQLLGVSNAILGVIFYLAVALLSLGVAFTAGERRVQLKGARALLLAVGLAYSLYLSYVQYVVLDQLCALCLISAAIATLLFVLQAIDLAKPGTTAASRRQAVQGSRGVAFYGALTALLVVLAAADVVYFSNLEPAASAALAGEAGACTFDPRYEPVEDWPTMVSSLDPTRGSGDAPVTIIEFFDPNCPHCKTMHPVLDAVAAQYGEQARIVYKPVAALGQISALPVAALHVAAQQGRFFEMLDLIFEHQKPTGYTMEEVRGYAARIGLDPGTFMAQVQSGGFAMLMRQQLSQFEQIGLRSVPSVLVNGRVVAPTARTVECLGGMIEAAS